jgi:2-C-methyl-D-erythritol 2,4-cyclodiphosphate synthase
MRIGHGYDVHAFGEGDHVVVGGVEIPFGRGLIAHSDGDVLIHAMCDALLGAVAEGDIGRHFPDSDPRWKGADSRQFLRATVEIVGKKRCRIENVDATIIAHAPRFAPYIQAMREKLAKDMQIGIEQLNIKATTTEGLGFTGRGEGLEAHAVVLLHEL